MGTHSRKEIFKLESHSCHLAEQTTERKNQPSEKTQLGAVFAVSLPRVPSLVPFHQSPLVPENARKTGRQMFCKRKVTKRCEETREGTEGALQRIKMGYTHAPAPLREGDPYTLHTCTDQNKNEEHQEVLNINLMHRSKCSPPNWFHPGAQASKGCCQHPNGSVSLHGSYSESPQDCSQNSWLLLFLLVFYI